MVIDALVQLTTVAQAAAVHIAASSSQDEDPSWLLVAGPAGAVALYTFLFRYYRNTDKSNQFERETKVELKHPITGSDTKAGERNGTRDSKVPGDNSRSFRQRVKRQ